MSFKRLNFGSAVSSVLGGIGGIIKYPSIDKYSSAEIKLAIGTTVKTNSGDEGVLEEVNDGWVILQVGKFLNKQHREFNFHQINYIPIIENMYKTKLGKLSRI